MSHNKRVHDFFINYLALFSFALLLLITDESSGKFLNKKPVVGMFHRGRAIVPSDGPSRSEHSRSLPDEKSITVSSTADPDDYDDDDETSEKPKTTDATEPSTENDDKPDDESTTPPGIETTTETLYPPPVDFFKAYRGYYEVSYSITRTL